MNPQTPIIEALAGALITEGVKEPSVVLEYPTDMSHGDYASNAAMVYAKELGKNPRDLAEALISTMGDIEGVDAVSVAGPGFINFSLTQSVLAGTLEEAVGDVWGRGDMRAGERVMVEYTDPNPFKEFHIGHLMSNTIGESIARLIEYTGATVVRANWQGDVGPHVAKAIWGKMQQPAYSWGEAYAYGAQHYEEHKKEIDEINKKVYAKNDAPVQALYNEGRASSLEHFEKLYRILGTTFDYYFFEGTEGLYGVPLVEEFLEKGIFEKSDGAVIFPGEKYGLHTRVFLTSQGLPTYETKELGLNKAKFDKEPKLAHSIIVTANEQSEYFKVVLKAMELVMPTVAEKTQHIAHGMMKLATGKMSSRTGVVITGEALLNTLIERAAERARESRTDDAELLARQIAVAAIKYQILKQASGKDIVFDEARALSLEGDSGPYIQYTHARCCSVLEKAGTQGSTKQPAGWRTTNVERLLVRFPEIVARAAEEYAPHHVSQYLIELASTFNSWYAQEHILDGSEAEQYKLAVVAATKNTLAKGLYLLGIEVPEKM